MTLEAALADNSPRLNQRPNQLNRVDELGCLPDRCINLKEPFPGAKGRSFYLNPGGTFGRVVPKHRPARREDSYQEPLITYGSDR